MKYLANEEDNERCDNDSLLWSLLVIIAWIISLIMFGENTSD